MTEIKFNAGTYKIHFLFVNSEGVGIKCIKVSVECFMNLYCLNYQFRSGLLLAYSFIEINLNKKSSNLLLILFILKTKISSVTNYKRYT